MGYVGRKRLLAQVALSRASVLASVGIQPLSVGGRLLGGTLCLEQAAGTQPFGLWALLCADESGACAFPGPFSVDSAQSVLLRVCLSVISGSLVHPAGLYPQIHQNPPGSCKSRHRSCAQTCASSRPAWVGSGSNVSPGPGIFEDRQGPCSGVFWIFG